ncbi:MAG TPA: TetR/AcrR family transcriptional regulator [Baekduia sp.]|nr:TetR/AcrR family transcriptional regulator [Baekduia sp.]
MSSPRAERTPQRRNGRRTKDLLLTAAGELLADRGYEGFNLTDVAKRAGVSYGSTYWYFADRDALLTAVHERLISELDAYTDDLRDVDRWEGAPLREVVEFVVRHLGRVYAHNPALLRALALRGGSDPGIMERSAPAVRDMGAVVGAVLVPHLEAAGHPDATQAAEDMYLTVSAVLAARVTWPVYFDRPGIPYDRLVDRLCEIAIADISSAVR